MSGSSSSGTARERIETARLSLRRPRRQDAEAIFAGYASDPEVTRLLGWPRHGSVEETRAFLDFSDVEWARWPAGPFVVEVRDGGGLVGSTGLAYETAYRAATGYVLARHAWGRGYATEVLGAMVELARTSGLRRLYAICHTAHAASARVLEKCGFEREALLRKYAEFPNLSPGEPLDVWCYARIFE